MKSLRTPGPLIVNGYRIEDECVETDAGVVSVWAAYDLATGERATFSDGSPAIGFVASDLAAWCKCQDHGRPARPCGFLRRRGT